MRRIKLWLNTSGYVWLCLADTLPLIMDHKLNILLTDLFGIPPPFAALLSSASSAVCAGSTLVEVEGCGVGTCGVCNGGVGVVMGFAVVGGD